MDGVKLVSRENFHIGIIGVIRVAITPKPCAIWPYGEKPRQIQDFFPHIWTPSCEIIWDEFCGAFDMPRFFRVKSKRLLRPLMIVIVMDAQLL